MREMTAQVRLKGPVEADGDPGRWLAYPAPEGIRDLDLAFGRFLAQQVSDVSETALRLAVLCSARLAQGHPCLDVAELCRNWQGMLPESWRTDVGNGHPAWLPVDLGACLTALSEASFVGSGVGGEPLVMHRHRLYLTRYWQAGVRIRANILRRLAAVTTESTMLPESQGWLTRVFPPTEADELDWQRIACANALLQGFSIITGGPGTGKTTTVVRLLAVLQGLAQVQGHARGLRIRLAAPTGKAAARLNESIAGALERLRKDADGALNLALDQVPVQVVTLHKLLGSRPDTRQLTYHAGHPLDLDVLVVDEASMMDVEMMDALLAALPVEARLVLLGDRDQLASVEAGAVLGELCARAPEGHYLPSHCLRLQQLCGQSPGPELQDAIGTSLDQAVVMLRHSYRFDTKSGIGRFAKAVNMGDVQVVANLCRDQPPGLKVVQPLGRGSAASVSDWLVAAGVMDQTGYPTFFQALRDSAPSVDAVQKRWDDWAAQLLAKQQQVQVLCALRQGPWGVEGLNRLIESRLRTLRLIPAVAGAWYPGRPVLVTRNQSTLGLANGDIGVTLPVPDPHRAGRRILRVAFSGATPETVRWVSPARLAAVETVYALTVHKSQGSEFNRVVLVLPDKPGLLLTRELLYTGATRARESLVLVLPGASSLLDEVVRHATHRTSGIWDPDA